MEDAKPRVPLWAGSLVVLVVSSVLVGVFLQFLASLGAQHFLQGISENVQDALSKLTPWELAVRYFGYFRIFHTNPEPNYLSCLSLSDCATPAYSFCRNSANINPISAAYCLLQDSFGRSVTGGIVDVLQMAAGVAFGAATVASGRKPGLGVYLGVVAVSVIATTILSIPVLLLVLLISGTLLNTLFQGPASPPIPAA